MRRKWASSPNVRGVAKTMANRRGSTVEMRHIIDVLEHVAPCDCPCHTSGQRVHDKGNCKCHVIRRSR